MPLWAGLAAGSLGGRGRVQPTSPQPVNTLRLSGAEHTAVTRLCGFSGGCRKPWRPRALGKRLEVPSYKATEAVGNLPEHLRNPHWGSGSS